MRARSIAALVALALGFVLASSAGARQQNYTYYKIYLHMNAYDHWGECNAEWHASSGSCDGLIEEGSFRHHTFPHSTKVKWTWSHSGTKLNIRSDHIYLDGNKPHNWFTFDVTSASVATVLYQSDFVAGVPAGQPGGPLYVDLRGHTGSIGHRAGMSMDLHGYLRAR
jgi:hypothetical protein